MSMTPSNPKPISTLRAGMIEDMTVRNFGAATQREYIRAVKKLAAYLAGRSPDTASAEELRAFQVHLSKTGTNPPTMNATVTALRSAGDNAASRIRARAAQAAAGAQP
jgi:hypothetical protein